MTGPGLERRLFLKSLALAAATTGAVTSATAQPATGPAPPLPRPAPLPPSERAYRYGRARALMQQLDLDAILVSSTDDDYEAGDYLAGPAGGAFNPIVALPRTGGPLAFAPPDVTALMPPTVLLGLEKAGIKPWIDHWRFGHEGLPQLVDDLKAAGLGQARIGTVNTLGLPLGDYVQSVLPQARLTDIAPDYARLRAPLSEAMQQSARIAAAYAEHATEVLAAAARPGVDEAELNMAVRRALVSSGATVLDLAFGSYDGLGGRYTPHRLRDMTNIGRLYDAGWRQRGLPPRHIASGDLMTTEIFCWVGGLQAQAQVTLSVGRVSPGRARLFQAVRGAYEAGVAAVRPGATLAQVSEAMSRTFPKGATSPEPNVRLLNPAVAFSPPTGASGRFDDLPIAEGMHLQIKPNLLWDGRFAGVGGAVLANAAGASELNAAPCAVQLIQA